MRASMRALVLVLVVRGDSLAIAGGKHGESLGDPHVTVFAGTAGDSEIKHMGEEMPVKNLGQHTVELTRFVTGYASNLEVLVDITPYSPILQAISDGKTATFYAFIGTFVTCLQFNSTGCSRGSHDEHDGHGWGVDVDLLFWPKAAGTQQHPQPRDTLVLGSGFFGSNHMFGREAESAPAGDSGYYWESCPVEAGSGKKCQTQHLFKRAFQLSLQTGDRVVLQLAVTGHGWAKTTLSCGEFCHAEYQVKFSGKKPLRISQWRDDCRLNPTGGNQSGTWQGPRNGWCPGSVEPGYYVDVTDQVKSGNNEMEFDAGVTINNKFVSYHDVDGFRNEDRAQLIVGLSMFVYSAKDVEAITGQTLAYTAAEEAIRGKAKTDLLVTNSKRLEQFTEFGKKGGNATRAASVGRSPLSLSWCHKPKANSNRSSSLGARMVRGLVCGALGGLAAVRSFVPPCQRLMARMGLAGGAAQAGTPLNIESHKPWYQYENMKADVESNKNHITTTPVFKGTWIHRDLKTATKKVSELTTGLPQDWDRVALHLKLGKPPRHGLGFDAWDRVASIGLFLEDTDNAVVKKLPV